MFTVEWGTTYIGMMVSRNLYGGHGMNMDGAKRLPPGEITGYGIKILDSICTEDDRILTLESRLRMHEIGGAEDEVYGWLTAVLALKAVSLGNAGVGCVLVDEERPRYSRAELDQFAAAIAAAMA